MKLQFKTNHLPTHGAGALYSYEIHYGKYQLRFWSGGYGNIEKPFGCWRWYPNITHYRRVGYHLCWLKYGISFTYLGY